MSTPQARPVERGYHQDYIARIRYENALPPPPGAPKLLNIPAEGLKYYTSATFSSRLARQQPLNIEADAELGMPIDLVGMPGIFDGDESCKSDVERAPCLSIKADLCTQLYKLLWRHLLFTQEIRTYCVLWPSSASRRSTQLAIASFVGLNTSHLMQKHELKPTLMPSKPLASLLLRRKLESP